MIRSAREKPPAFICLSLSAPRIPKEGSFSDPPLRTAIQTRWVGEGLGGVGRGGQSFAAVAGDFGCKHMTRAASPHQFTSGRLCFRRRLADGSLGGHHDDAFWWWRRGGVEV